MVRIPNPEESVRRWNSTQTPFPRATIHELFAAQARQTPDATAIVAEGESWTYGQLHEHACSVARALRERAVRAGDVVAVALAKSPAAIGAVFGVLMTGSAYLPLDPELPSARRDAILDQSGVRVVLTRDNRADRMRGVHVAHHGDPRPEPQVRDSPRHDTTADDPAYVIYTSGSTGVPKGVVVPHRGAVRLVRDTNYLRIGPDDTVLATTNLTFDVSCFEIFGALLNGGRLVLPDIQTLLSPHDLRRLIEAHDVTVMWLSAGLFHQHAIALPEMFTPLRCLIAGGDALNPRCVRAVIERGRPRLFLNGYGPTENSVFSTTHEITRLPAEALTVPIGRPIANSTAYVLRPDLGLAAIGEEGELFLGGAGVALGYLNAPELTAQCFVADPFANRPGARMYRTGDMARWRPDGVLEFLGRRDRQVKIRGFRVELREIELVLNAHPAVAEAVVERVASERGERLCAWAVVSAAGDERRAGQELRRHLRDHLPSYMIPDAVHLVRSLPLNASGKVRRSALLDRIEPGRPADPTSLRGIEAAVAAAWRVALGTDAITSQTDFVTAGGQSLHTAQVAVAVCGKLGIDPGLIREIIRDLLDNPTLARFSARVAERARMAERASAAGRPPGVEPGQAADQAADQAPDWAAEGAPGALVIAAAPSGRCRTSHVLLSGPTGFLGCHLLDRLAAEGVDRIYCLVRAHDVAQARSRLAARMRRYGLDWAAVSDSVAPVPGDLAQPCLGLAERDFRLLGERLDHIIHSGAHVNFGYPYAALRAPNVDGTREIVRLAATGTATALHHISSISVLAGFGVAGRRAVSEDEPLAYPERLGLGYSESKWVAEQLVHQASARGLPVAVYRPAEISGASATGIWNTDTLVCALIRTIAESGLAPEMPLIRDLVPVDFVARAVVRLALSAPAQGQVWHITRADRELWPLLLNGMRDIGYQVELVPYRSWVAAMARQVMADAQHPLVPYLHMFLRQPRHGPITAAEAYLSAVFPRADSRAFTAAASIAGLSIPRIDQGLTDRYLGYLTRSGFLAPPAQRGGHPAPSEGPTAA